MPRTPVGDLLDKLGVAASLADDDLVAAAVVLIKVVEGDGSVRLATAYSDGLSWIERIGMLRSAEASDLNELRHTSAESG